MKEVYFFKDKMYSTVFEILERYKTVWQANLGLVSDVAEAKALIVVINDNAVFDNRTLGTTAGKNQKYEQMCEGCLTICNSGFKYGSKIKDDNIKISFNYSLSDIKKGSEKAVYERCMAITASALPIETVLTTTYDLPTAFLAAQDLRNSAFHVLIDASGKIIEHGKSIKVEMVDEYHDVDIVFNERIDRTIFSYKKTNPNFYTEYKSGRIIGNRHNPPKPIVPPTNPDTPAE